jgi:hypothetical protein
LTDVRRWCISRRISSSTSGSSVMVVRMKAS